MGTHLRVLSESYPMNTTMTGVKMVFKNRYVLVLLAKVASALEELNMKEKMKTCFLSESIHLYLILLRIDQIKTRH